MFCQIVPSGLNNFNNQKGFTLLEILVALAVSGVVVIVVVASIFGVTRGTIRSNSQTVSHTDVNMATLSIQKDLLMAQTTNLTTNPQSSVLLEWWDLTSSWGALEPTKHTCEYIWSGTQLERYYDESLVAEIVGRHITYLGFAQNGRVIDVTITATDSDTQQSKTVTFSAYIRSFIEAAE